jgi:hypothetical protein
MPQKFSAIFAPDPTGASRILYYRQWKYGNSIVRRMSAAGRTPKPPDLMASRLSPPSPGSRFIVFPR